MPKPLVQKKYTLSTTERRRKVLNPSMQETIRLQSLIKTLQTKLIRMETAQRNAPPVPIPSNLQPVQPVQPVQQRLSLLSPQICHPTPFDGSLDSPISASDFLAQCNSQYALHSITSDRHKITYAVSNLTGLAYSWGSMYLQLLAQKRYEEEWTRCWDLFGIAFAATFGTPHEVAI